MATSGSFDFDRTRNEIIIRALRILGVIAQGDNPTAEQLTEGAEALNVMTKNLQSEGLGLWAREWTEQTLTASSTVTGDDGKIYTAVRSHLSVAGASGDQPIAGANFSSFWIQEGSAGAAWAAATQYNAIGDFTPEADTIWIEDAFVRRADTDHIIDVIRFSEYFEQVTRKDTTGLTIELAFDFSLSNPTVFLAPQPDNVTDVIHYLRYRKLQDFDNPADNPDSPVLWIEVLTFGLAYRLAPEYGIPIPERAYLKNEAEQFLNKAKRNDSEVISTEFITSAY